MSPNNSKSNAISLGIVISILIATTTALSANMVRNDRLRASEDIRVEDKLTNKIEAMSQDITVIKVQMARQTALMERMAK